MQKILIFALILFVSFSLVAEPRNKEEVKQEIELINAMLKFDRAGATWEAKETSVSFLSDEDMHGKMGLVPPATRGEEVIVDTSDWPRGEMKVANITPIRNQSSCGSCVAFASVAALEQTLGTGVDLSERYLFFCDPYKGYGCNGGWSLNGGAAAIQQPSKGVIYEKDCPYTSYNCGCSGSNKIVRSYAYASASQFKSILDQGKALIIGMNLYGDFRHYRSGIYKHTSGSSLGGHAMCLVGYGRDSVGAYWIVKNSWGTGWGRNGYLYIYAKSTGMNQQSNIENWGGYYFR